MNYRLYTFINFYLSQIQGGIQSAHVLGEFVNKYDKISRAGKVFYEWNRCHKTMIVLNGGANGDLQDLLHMVEEQSHSIEIQIGEGLPYACFFEDEYSLAKIMTGVGIVLPEIVYDAVDYKRAMNSVSDAKEFADTYDINRREDTFFWLQKNSDGELEVAAHFMQGTATANLIKAVKSCKLF